MKRSRFLYTVLIAANFLFACSPGSSSGDNSNPTQNVTAGSWKVTLFTDSGNDETTDFAGYTFVFNSNGVLNATKNSVTQNGTWSSGSGKFNIDLGPKDNTNKPLGELTDDWIIISSSATELKLKDDNSSSAEHLTFTKL